MSKPREVIFFSRFSMYDTDLVFHKALMKSQYQVAGPSVCGRAEVWVEEGQYDDEPQWVGIDMPLKRAEQIGRPCKLCFNPAPEPHAIAELLTESNIFEEVASV